MIARTVYHMPHSIRNVATDFTQKYLSSSLSSSVFRDFDFIKARAMGSRPLSLHIPAGHYPSVRPTLDEVLSNTAPYPYTLSAFMAYLSQNHCLETLEFTMEANRYRDTYQSVANMLGQSIVPPDAPQTQQLTMLWRRLITAYVAPGAPREINLSSAVRDPLLANTHSVMAPHPELLDPAVRIMRDLMEESIFIHFINSRTFASGMESSYAEDRARNLRLTTSRSHQSGSNEDLTHHRMSSSSRVAALVKTGSQLSGYSSSGESGSPVFTDESLSSSPSGMDMMTPPNTPPGNEHNYSLRNRSDTTWKKMGAKLGFKKRAGSSSRDARCEE